MNKRILVIEDDQIQAEELSRRLREAGHEPEQISTELEFNQKLDSWNHDEVEVAIVDMMIRWTNPSANMQMPDAVTMAEGFYTAGLRCCRKLRKKLIPCVIFSAFDQDRVQIQPDDAFAFVNKSEGYKKLFEVLRQIRQQESSR